MKVDSIVIRIDYRDLVTLYKIFRPYRDESVAEYFHRLAIEMKGGKI